MIYYVLLAFGVTALAAICGYLFAKYRGAEENKEQLANSFAKAAKLEADKAAKEAIDAEQLAISDLKKKSEDITKEIKNELDRIDESGTFSGGSK